MTSVLALPVQYNHMKNISNASEAIQPSRQTFTTRKRQTQSCDRCKSKKRRCNGEYPCGNCVKANTDCTMLIEQKKRGPKRISDDSAELSYSVGRANAEKARNSALDYSLSDTVLLSGNGAMVTAVGVDSSSLQNLKSTKRARHSTDTDYTLPIRALSGSSENREDPLSHMGQHQPSHLYSQQQFQLPLHSNQGYTLPTSNHPSYRLSNHQFHALTDNQVSRDMSGASLSEIGVPNGADSISAAIQPNQLSFNPASLNSITMPSGNGFRSPLLSLDSHPTVPPLHNSQSQFQLLQLRQNQLQQQELQNRNLQGVSQSQLSHLSQSNLHTPASVSQGMTTQPVFDIPASTNRNLESNLSLDPSQLQSISIQNMLGGNYLKSSTFNSQEYIPNSNPDFNNSSQIQIDPEVLNLYAQLNPKMSVDLNTLLVSPSTDGSVPSADLSFNIESLLYGPVNLTLAEFPNLPSEFFLHLISMFFTYYHPTFPIIHETPFFENLIPINKHHQMLLNAIYAIGCHYSQNSLLYQTPFYSPQRASEYFMDRAFAAVPPPESKHFTSPESLAICQAAILLTSCDYSLKRCRTWTTIGMGCRLAEKYELYYSKSLPDFFSLYNGSRKTCVPVSLQERKRVWWVTLLADLFVSLSTGIPLQLGEAEYVDTMLDTTTLIDRVSPKLANGQSPIGDCNDNATQKVADPEKWKPFFSGFPKDTVFGPTDLTSDRWTKQSLGFFQVNHLFSNLDESMHIIQLSYIVRRIVRSLHAPALPKSTKLNGHTAPALQSLSNTGDDMQSLHTSLLVWYEGLPLHFRLFHSLEATTTIDVQGLAKFCSIKEGRRVCGMMVMLNLLLFSAFALLHQRNAESTAISFDNADETDEPVEKYIGLQPGQQLFSISTSQISHKKYQSHQIIAFMYKAQCHLLKSVYGSGLSTSSTTTPPSEIVCSPMIATLMMPIAVALMCQKGYARRLVFPLTGVSTIDMTTETGMFLSGIDPLDAVILPVLKSISQVWSAATDHATTLRTLSEKIVNHVATMPKHQNAVSSVHPKTDSWFEVFQTGIFTLGPSLTNELSRTNEPATSSAPANPNHASLSIAASPKNTMFRPTMLSTDTQKSHQYSHAANSTNQYSSIPKQQSGPQQGIFGSIEFSQQRIDPVVVRLLNQSNASAQQGYVNTHSSFVTPTGHSFSSLNIPGATHAVNYANIGQKEYTQMPISNQLIEDRQGVQRSWHDLRSEFEDEFLL
ncbi:hypothetical protein QVD99_000812 [Batrachochytrium dendrobatidis]|nr:hypothetical protein QVD99_000812 [Batrachochytrium dendrobatidis]